MEWKEEDKKFASKAVAYVIKHSRKGIIPLCASVATLLQERARLQKQVKSLQDHMRFLKNNGPHDSSTCTDAALCHSGNSSLPALHPQNAFLLEYNLSDSHISMQTEADSSEKSYIIAKHVRSTDIAKNCTNTQNFQKICKLIEKTNSSQRRIFKTIDGCKCGWCISAASATCSHLVPPLHYGEKIIVQGEMCGIVKYVGHIDDSFTINVVFAGIQLDEPVGDNNGNVNGKTYFTCPKNCGIFIPLTDVLCKMR